MAVDRGNLTPSPAPEPKLPVGRTALVKTMRGGLTPPSQASTGTPVALTASPFNPGLQT